MQRIEIGTSAGPRSALVWDGAGPDAPWLHFAHATGMHAGLYARLLAPLADRFRIVASDARGHGHSPGGPVGPLVEWEVFAADIIAVMSAVAANAPWLLAGHSMGGTTSLLAAAAHPARVAGLVLLDPPFIPFAAAREILASGERPQNPMADQAARRRADFPDVATARAAWHGRGVFRTWSDADLDAYLADGMLATLSVGMPPAALSVGLPPAAAAGEGVTLACAPAWEAATFRGVTLRFEAALAALACPFALLAGESGSTVHATEFALIAAHPHCIGAERLPGTTHFLPLERGDAVRAAIVHVAAAAGVQAAVCHARP
jgi:pimeloyl-ACP methyl ester carboxylesterase